MKDILYVLLGFSLIIGGLILQIEIGSLDTSSWNFTGSPMAIALTKWLGGLLMAVGALALILIGYEESR